MPLFAIACSGCFFAGAAAAEVVVEKILDGLQNPCGVAVQPSDNGGQYAVFVSDTSARRVVIHPSGRPGTALPFITEFPARGDGGDATGLIPSAGPLGLLFLDQRRIVVGVAGDDEAVMRLYELRDGGLPIAADQATQQVRLPDVADEERSTVRGVYALARTRTNDYVPDLLIVACLRGDGGFELWKIPVRAGTLGEAALFVASGGDAGPGTAPAIAVSQQGFVVAAETGSNGQPTRLTFYEPVDERIVVQMPVELRHVVALAYSPQTGNLYAADLGSGDDRPGGVYRIDDASEPGQPAATAVRIADVPRPTALAFSPDGALYVTALGEPDDDEANTGVLLKFTGDL